MKGCSLAPTTCTLVMDDLEWSRTCYFAESRRRCGHTGHTSRNSLPRMTVVLHRQHKSFVDNRFTHNTPSVRGSSSTSVNGQRLPHTDYYAPPDYIQTAPSVCALAHSPLTSQASGTV